MKQNEVILQIFDENGEPKKRVHDCYLCKIYKREMARGNKDAYTCYVNHLNYVASREGGISIKVKK
ncbi:MAG: hypothetical protein M1158_00280 [Candidatus Marsarchaeota archaeon]|jgi:hypothetical protein|nr:hypothetical protein [Candidatus Marsarchaeota archaeon]